MVDKAGHGPGLRTYARKMGSIVAFYRYLKDVENIKFKFPMWEDGITSISYQDRQGIMQNKQVATTDLAKNVASKASSEHVDGGILDGGRKLHPLDPEEQNYLFRALNEIGNIEMKLAFLIAIATGARMQTVFTLRQKHFEKPAICIVTSQVVCEGGPEQRICQRLAKGKRGFSALF